ncbi:hypothetical protein AAA085_13535, partial [Thomasclavelia ramosa]
THLFPYRTQKLSIITAKIVPRCDNSKLPVLFLFTDTSAYPFFILYPALIINSKMGIFRKKEGHFI